MCETMDRTNSLLNVNEHFVWTAKPATRSTGPISELSKQPLLWSEPTLVFLTFEHSTSNLLLELWSLKKQLKYFQVFSRNQSHKFVEIVIIQSPQIVCSLLQLIGIDSLCGRLLRCRSCEIWFWCGHTAANKIYKNGCKCEWVDWL